MNSGVDTIQGGNKDDPIGLNLSLEIQVYKAYLHWAPPSLQPLPTWGCLDPLTTRVVWKVKQDVVYPRDGASCL